MSGYLLLLIMPAMVTTGQVLLKKSAGNILTGEGLRRFVLSFLKPGIIAGIAAVAFAPLIYIKALGEVPLSEAFAFNSLNYVLVFFSGRLILRERVNPLQITGVILITAGFLIPLTEGF